MVKYYLNNKHIESLNNYLTTEYLSSVSVNFNGTVNAQSKLAVA